MRSMLDLDGLPRWATDDRCWCEFRWRGPILPDYAFRGSFRRSDEVWIRSEHAISWCDFAARAVGRCATLALGESGFSSTARQRSCLCDSRTRVLRGYGTTERPNHGCGHHWQPVSFHRAGARVAIGGGKLVVFAQQRAFAEVRNRSTDD